MKWLNAILIFLGLIALVLVLLVATQALIAKLKMDAVMDRIEDASLPTTWEEFVATFPDHEQQIAARPRFIAAMEAVCRDSEVSDDHLDLLPIEGTAELPELDAAFPPLMLVALDARLTELDPEFDELHEALQSDPFWRQVDKPSSPASWFDVSAGTALRQSTRLLVMSAVRHVEHGEADAAADAGADALRLSRVPQRGGLLIDGLIRAACERLAVAGLEYVLARTDPSPDRLATLDAVLSEYPSPRTAAVGELVYVLETGPETLAMSRAEIRDTLGWMAGASWQSALAFMPDRVSWLRLNQAYEIQYTLDAIEAWDLPWDEFRPRHDAAAGDVPAWCPIAAMSQQFGGCRSIALCAEGAWRCARIAVAIERYARDHGTLPPRLDDLVPEYLAEVPTEPFHGNPIDYTTDGATGRLGFPIPAGVSGRPFTFDLLAVPPGAISQN